MDRKKVSKIWIFHFRGLFLRAFLRLGNLYPEAVQTQKSPSGQLPEGRRPEGLGSKNKSSMIAVFGRFCSAVAIRGA